MHQKVIHLGLQYFTCFPLTTNYKMPFIFILLVGYWLSGCVEKAPAPQHPMTGIEATTFLQNPDTLVTDTPEDRRIFEQKWHIARKTPGGMPEKALAVMQSFAGTPYGYQLLDRSSEEHLTVNLRALDCWTSVEICVAIAHTATDAKADYRHFCSILRQLRYRDGITNGYGSRLHYFSEWIMQNARMGYVEDVTEVLGGVPLQKTISFITDNPVTYPKSLDPGAVEGIRVGQEFINGHKWYYLPKKQVASMEQRLRSGDVLVLTSVESNLDVEHQGFAIRKNGRIHLLHASSTGKKVLVSSKPLSGYLASVPQMSGLIVARLK